MRSLRLFDANIAELTMLCGFDDDLADHNTRASNRMRALSMQIRPSFGPVLRSRLDHAAVLELIERYPSPKQFAKLTER